MGNIFTLDDDVKQVIKDALDDIITELGKMCRLYYPPKWVNCANCIFDSIGNKSSNRWRTGGPIRFPNGTTCPLCGGQGKRADESYEDIRLLCSVDPRKFWVPLKDVNITIPDGVLQTKGYLTDLPKIQRAEYLMFQTAIAGHIKYKYTLYGEPIDSSNIIQDRYFIANWRRISS